MVNLHKGFQGFVPLPENGATVDTNARRKKMSVADQQYIVSCVRAYKDNYKKMMMDIDVNSRQLTENQLKRMAEKYFSLTADEIDVVV